MKGSSRACCDQFWCGWGTGLLLASHVGSMQTGGKTHVRTHVGVHRQTDLLEIVRALRPPSRFTRGLNGRQQHADENGDDGNHDKQLDQA